MSDEQVESKVRDTIEAVTGLVKAVPVYEDALQPAAKELGKALGTVAKLVNVALAPVSALVWGYDKLHEFVETKVAEKLENTPEENIKSPPPNVAGPALEALRYTGHAPELREMFANLLAGSMDSRTSATAHPCFVEIIKQMTPDEAKLMQLFAKQRPFPIIELRNESINGKEGGVSVLRRFSMLGVEAGCRNPNLTPTYLDNFERLGLIAIPQFAKYTADEAYKPLEEWHEVKALADQIGKSPGRRAQIQRNGAWVTDLGRAFVNSCVVDHRDVVGSWPKPLQKT